MSPAKYIAQWVLRVGDAPPSQQSQDDDRLLDLIRESHEASGRTYGAPRILCDLREVGERVGKNRIAEIMKRHKIRAQRGDKQPGIRYTKPAVTAPNRLQQQLVIDRPDRAWVTDITSIRTDDGWLYLAVVMDPYSRRIIGWSMKSILAKEIVLNALLVAVWRPKPEQDVIPLGSGIAVQQQGMESVLPDASLATKHESQRERL